MQERDHFKEVQHSARQASQAEDIHFFQEVVYPLPLWKRTLLAVSQFVLGIVVGLGLLWLAYVADSTTGGTLMCIGLIIISMPSMIWRKTRLFGFGLLVVLLVMLIFIIIAYSSLN